MSINHRHPRQDRRGLGRSVVAPHANTASVGHDKGNAPCPDCKPSASNAATNAKLAAIGSPSLTTNAGALVASGAIRSSGPAGR